jgi:predicted Zn-ribbon and HTH transcriptional regulator
MAETFERGLGGHVFKAGDVVSVRCIVTSITPASQGAGGAGDSVLLTVETPGNVGEKAGVTLTVSPVQCKFAGYVYQRS